VAWSWGLLEKRDACLVCVPSSRVGRCGPGRGARREPVLNTEVVHVLEADSLSVGCAGFG